MNLSFSKASTMCLAPLLFTLLMLGSCSNAAKIETLHKQEKTKLQALPDVENPPFFESEALEPEPTPSVFLRGLSDKDIEIVKAEARRTTLKNWGYISKRSQHVHGRMLDVFTEMEAPLELLFVPVAESGYNPYALSPTGALGLWQLMPRTAIELGTTHKHGVDGRRHVEQSTKAAIKYFQSLYNRFGSWPLAIAAYNLGPWGVQRRLNKKSWDISKGLNKMPFPSETRHYVKQILGLIALQEAGEISFPEHIETKPLQLDAPIDLVQMESISGLNKNQLFHLNPGLDFQRYLSHSVQLHLPQLNINAFQQQLAQNPDILKPKFITVKIRKGDSLWKIAHRHHTNIAYLRKLNPKLRNTLSIGHSITVPAANSFVAASHKTNPLLAKGKRIRYKVKSGDSLWTIAKKFGTSTKSIARINQISINKLIRPGDRLWIVARFRPS